MSDYIGFEVKVDNDDGTTTMLPLETVTVYDVTNDTPLSPDLTSDANGLIAPGTLAVAAGTLIRFSVQRADGISGYAEQLTT